MTQISNCSYLRFINNIDPSVFDIPDDGEVDLEGRIKAAALVFEPRSIDQGCLSVWKLQNIGEFNRLQAGFAALFRKKLENLNTLRIPDEVLENAHIEIKSSPNLEAFSCIAHLHYGLDLADQKSREALARELINWLAAKNLTLKSIYSRTRKQEIKEITKSVYLDCSPCVSQIDIDKAQPWARNIVINI